MPEAVKTDATDRDTLRKMCDARGIEYHHANGAPALQAKVDEWEKANAPPSGPKVDVDTGTGFASAAPPESLDRQTAAEAVAASPPAAKHKGAETYIKSTHELPTDVSEALEWFSGYSIGRVNRVKRYIESLL